MGYLPFEYVRVITNANWLWYYFNNKKYIEIQVKFSFDGNWCAGSELVLFMKLFKQHT